MQEKKRLIKLINALGMPLYLGMGAMLIYYFAVKGELLLSETPLLPPFVIAAPIIAVTFLLWLFFRFQNFYLEILIERSRLGRIGMNLGQIHTLNKLMTAIVCFIGLILMVKALGYDASVLLTIGGVGGAFLAFATKDFIANFFGGLIIYLTRPFTIGDRIKLHGRDMEGQVEQIGWYLTRITDLEKQPVHIPNSMFSQLILITPSKRSHQRIKETVSVSPQDFDKIPMIIDHLKREISHLEQIDQKEALEIYFSGSDTKQLNIEILAYTKELKGKDYKHLLQTIRFKVRECIESAGAHVPLSYTEIEMNSPINININKGEGQ